MTSQQRWSSARVGAHSFGVRSYANFVLWSFPHWKNEILAIRLQRSRPVFR